MEREANGVYVGTAASAVQQNEVPPGFLEQRAPPCRTAYGGCPYIIPIKKPLVSERLSGGGILGEAPVAILKLLRLLLRVGAHRRSAVAGELFEIVLQQADLDASAGEALGLRILVRRRQRGIAHSYEVDAIDRDVMVENQVADDGFGHLLRSRDGSLSFAGREALDFDDVAALSLNAAGHLV